MFPCSRKTNQNTDIYVSPAPWGLRRKITVRKGVNLQILELKRFEKYENSEWLFARTPAGWALIQKDYNEFLDVNRCPVCLDTTDFGNCEEKTPCCGKDVHIDCMVAQINAGHSGKLLGFNHLKCPCCRDYFDRRGNWWGLPEKLRQAMKPHKEMRDKIEYLSNQADEALEEGEEKGGWAFFNCQDCNKPFCGGKVSCAQELNLDTKKMTCSECMWQTEAKDHRCFKHGRKYAIFKCDSCCAPASWSCTSNHYCERCHNQAGRNKFYPCPGGDKCSLGIPHPANIGASHMSQRTVSFVIGCEKCDLGEAAVAYEYDSCADAFAEKQPDNVHSIFTYKSYKEIREEEEAQKKKEKKAEEEVVVELEPQPLNIPAPNENEEEVEEEEARVFDEDDESSDDFSLMGGHLFEEPEDLPVEVKLEFVDLLVPRPMVKMAS